MSIQHVSLRFGHQKTKYTPMGGLERNDWNGAFISHLKNNQTGDTIELRHDTYWERTIALTNQLPKLLQKRFPNGVKILDYACSEGIETYHILLMLIKKLGLEEAEKYLPVYGFDLSPAILKRAREATYLDELNHLPTIFGEAYEDFFETAGKYAILDRVADPYRDMAQFKVDDLTERAKKPFTEPVVLLFRNAWYLLPNHEIRLELIRNLFQNLAPKSLLMIGQGETGLDKRVGDLGKIMVQEGFKRLGWIPFGPKWCMFEKPDPSTQTRFIDSLKRFVQEKTAKFNVAPAG